MIQNPPRRASSRPLFVLPYSCREPMEQGSVILAGAVVIGNPEPQLLLARELLKNKEKSE